MAAEPTVVRGACPHDCPDTCAWEVTVGTAWPRARGVKEHPFTRGGLCAKVNHYLERVYSPDRILHPLRAPGPKGDGRFERVGWDEALDEIAAASARSSRSTAARRSCPTATWARRAWCRAARSTGASSRGSARRGWCARSAVRPRPPGARAARHAGRDAPRGHRPQPVHRALGDEHDRHEPAPVAVHPGRRAGRARASS